MQDTLLDEIRSLPQRERPADNLAPWRDELAGYVAQMKDLRTLPVDQALGWLSSVSARLLEMRLASLQSDARNVTRWRIDALIPFVEETRYQFSIHSRRLSADRLEFDLSGGQVT